MTKIACKHGGTITNINTAVIPDDYRHATVEVTRWQRNDDGEYKYIVHTYKITWYNIGMVMLRQWTGEQSFGASRGKIDIRQNAYVYGIVPSVFYNIHRMKRREVHHQFVSM